MLRRGLAVLTVAALSGSALVGLPLLASPAAAISAPVAFSAQRLPTWQTNGVVYATATAQGLLFAGGRYSRIRPPGEADLVTTTNSDGSTTTSPNPDDLNRSSVAVLDAATGNPTSCTLDLGGSSASVRSLVASPDGTTMYVGGYFSSIGGVARSNLAAVDVASCTVTSWAPSANSYVKAIVAIASTVYVGGAFTSINGQNHQQVAALSPADGSVNAGFTASFTGTTHDGITPDVNAMALKPDGSVLVVGGNFDQVNGADSHALGVVDSGTGATVKAFPGFITPYTNDLNHGSAIKSIVVDSTGFYTGNEGTGKFVFDGRIAVNWDTYAERWRDACLGATQALLLYHDLLYIASHAHDCSNIRQYGDGSRRHFLAETTGSTSPNDHSKPVLQGWSPDTNDGTGEGIGPRSLTLASVNGTDYLWSGGEFTTVNGTSQQGLTRFSNTTGNGQTVNPTIAVSSYKAGLVTVAVRSTYDNDDGLLTYKVYRDGSSTPAYTTTQFSLQWNRPQLTWTDSQPSGSTHTYRVTATDGNNTSTSSTQSVTVASTGSTYAQQVESDNPLLHLRYDESAGLFLSDASGNINNLRLNSTTGLTYQETGALAGDPSTALSFSGDPTSYAVTEKRFDAPTTFTLETWFKTGTTTGGKLIGFTDSQQLPSQEYDARNLEHHVPDKLLYMTNSGQLIFGTEGTVGTYQTLTTPGTYANNSWHYVVASQDSKGMNLYVDGARVAQNTVTTNATGNGFWRVGGDSISPSWPSVPSSGYFAGAMDETAVYYSALSATQVSQHYALGGGALADGPTDDYGKTVYDDQPLLQWRLNEASGTPAADSSGLNNGGKYTGTVTYAQPSAVAGTSGATARSVKLDGSTSLISSAASSSSLAQFTTEAWVKTTSTTGGQIAGFGSSATGDSSTQDRKTWFRNDGRISFGLRQGSAYTVITSPTAYNDGSFHHVVATKSATVMALWVDGQQVASQSVTANQSYTGYWRFGEDTFTGWSGAPTSKFLNGTLDELAVYGSVLSPAKIASHYSAGAPSAGPDVSPPTVPANVNVGLVGANASLSWRASLDNVGVTGYEVHRSTTAGFTPSSSDLLATVTSTAYTDTNIPQGTYYYRIVALDAAGNRTSSVQVSVLATDVSAPTAPANVVATGGSSSASLSWNASTDNTGVTGYTVYRSATSGFTPSTATLIATTTDPSYTDTPPTNGTYYYLVTAQDAAGNVSAPSTQVSASVNDTTPPSTPGTLVGTATAGTANLSWGAATDDTAVAGYQLYRSATAGVSPSSATLVKTVATNAATDAPGLGTWYYRVVAVDGAGNQSPSSNELRVFVATTSTQIPVADTFANQGAPSTNYGTNASLVSNGGTSGAAISYLRFAIPSVPAGSYVSTATLRIHTSTRAKCSCDASSATGHPIMFANNTWDESSLTWANKPAFTSSAIGTISAPNVEDTSFDTALSTSSISGVNGTTVTLAIQGTTTDNLYFGSSNNTTAANRPQLFLTLSPNGFDPQAPTQPAGLAATRNGGTVSLTWNASTDPAGSAVTYSVYRSATGSDGGTLLGTATTPTFTDNPGIGTWYYTVIAADAGGHTSPASDPLAVSVPDYTAPSAPSAVTVTNSGPRVSLSWTASTDDVGVQSYEVHRSTTSGFTPSSATLVTTVTGTSATDKVAAGTYYYVVVAKDAAGNATSSAQTAITITDTSAPSAPTGVTVTQSGAPVTVSWTAATDDFAVASYSVFRGGTLLGTVTSAGSTTYTDPTPPAGSTSYTVTATDPSGNTGPSSAAATLTVTDVTAPTTITDLAGVRDQTTLNNADLTWSAATDNTGVTSYVISRNGTVVGSTTSTSYVDAAGPGTWTYTVVAKDAAGNAGAASNQVTVPIDDRTAPTTPTNLTSSVSGPAVTLSWTASTDDVAVQNYEIHRSATSGFTTSSTTLLTTTTSTSYTDRPGGGQWYYRVDAVDTSGNQSAASNQASANLTDTTPPSTPTNVASSQTGQAVSLTWTASTDDYGVAAYDVYRSPTSGFTPSSATLLGSSTTLSYTDTPALGTFSYRVVARDGAGNVSPGSTELAVTVTDKTPPSATTVTATVSGTSVGLSWTASTDNVGVTGYEVHRGTTSSFVPSSANLLTTTTGLSYTDSPGPGTWYYEVVTLDAAGNATTSSSASASIAGQSTTVTVSPTADAFGNQGAPSTNYGTNTSLLSKGGTTAAASSYLRFVIPAAPAGTTLTGAALKIKTSSDSTAGSTDTHTITVASDSWTESTLTWNNRPAVNGAVLGQLVSPSAVSTAYSATLDPNAVSSIVGTQATIAITDTGTDGMYFWSSNYGTASARPSLVLTYTAAGSAADTTPPTAPGSPTATASGTNVALSWTASTDDTGVVGYDVYRSATSGSGMAKVGTSTTTSYTDTPGTGTWYYTVIARDAAGNQSPASTQVSATVTPPADTTAPTAPGSPSAVVSGSTVSLSWGASTDNVGVTGYEVHRSTTSGFTPSSTTLVTTVTGTSATDSPGVGTFYYEVVARDAAGNGGFSSQVLATTQAAGPSTVLSVTPTADSFANAGATSTNYGTNTSLLSKGGTSAGTSYLRFVLPAAPSGQTLTGAVLRIHTSTDSTAGSTDTHTIAVASDSWDESTLTWANRPAITSTVLGSITTASAVNTSYDTALSVSAVGPLVGTQQSIAISDTGTDGMYFWSRNYGTAASRPQLILTFS